MALIYPWSDHPSPGEMREVAPGVGWITMPMGGSLNHINLYLLADGDAWWIVDTGLNTEATRETWCTVLEQTLAGAQVKGVICTHMHPDHVGQALMLTERFQAPLYMSQAEYYQARAFSAGGGPASGGWISEQFYLGAGMPKAFLEGLRKHWEKRQADPDAFTMPQMPGGFRRLRDGDVLDIGGRDWHVLVGNGHSPEHACLHCREIDLMISGDQILPRITSNVSVFPSEPKANPLKDWLDSHDRFLGVVPEETLVLPAHNLPFHGARERLRELIDHHEDRMLAIEEHCADQPCTARDLLPVLFRRKLDIRQEMMALGEAVAHVHLLLYRGRLQRHLDDQGTWQLRAIDPSLARRAQPGRHTPPGDEPSLV